MNVLVFGKTGQVAHELMQYNGVTCVGRDEANLLDLDACRTAILSSKADVVINAAAYTYVDLAENNYEIAMKINAETPIAMAIASAKRCIPFVHISTDYVFDGLGNKPFKIKDTPDPQSVYGKSKLEGENGIVAAGGVCAILRTSWVFSKSGTNFVKTMLRLASDRDVIKIVADQVGGPTPAYDIAASCMKMAHTLVKDPNAAGIYHFSGKPDVSWADFAREIFQQSGLNICVEDIRTSEYHTIANRPLNSRLDCKDMKLVFDIERPDWRQGLQKVINDLRIS
jgi:dTDP-4-dehydrorhamnose reductase